MPGVRVLQEDSLLKVSELFEPTRRSFLCPEVTRIAK